MDAPERVDLLVRGGTVVTVDADERVLRADVAVRDGTIVAIGADLAVEPDDVLDATDAAVIPGLVNAHMHETLDRSVFEDLPFTTWLQDFALPKDRAYQPHHMRAAGLLNQAEMIAGGTTCFIDIFRHPREVAEVAEVSGLRATISPQIIDDPEGAGERLDDSAAFVAEWRDRVPDRIRAWFGPHSLYTCHPETFRTIRELADELGVGIHTHLAESRAETAIVSERAGCTPVEWLDDLVGLGRDLVVAHCIELTDGDLARLAASGAGVAHCPTSNMKLGNGRARIAELLEHGAVVGVGTDSNMTNNDLDMFEELRLAALVQKQLTGDPAVLPSAAALRLATMGSAAVLGLDERIGSIEVGKAADLAVVDLRGAHARPLVRRSAEHPPGNVVEQVVWACNARDVRHTVVDGRVLMRDRTLTTLDVADVVELADREIVDLLRRAGVLERRFGDA